MNPAKNGSRGCPTINVLASSNDIIPPYFDDDQHRPQVLFVPDETWARCAGWMIDQAKKTIRICTFKFDFTRERTGARLGALFLSLIAANGRGVEIRLLLNAHSKSRSTSPANLAASGKLKNIGITPHYLPGGRCCHAKILTSDSRSALVGSHNWTQSSADRNAEASILTFKEETIKDAILFFDKLWAKSLKT